MNDIVYAGRKRTPEIKYTTIFFADDVGAVKCKGKDVTYRCGQIVVLPPLSKCENFPLGVLRIFIDKALLPFKEPKVLDDDKNGGIKFALIQAEKYYENPQKNEGILSGLGGLIAAYVGVFSNLDSLSPVVKMVKGEIEGNLSNCLFSLDDYIKKLPLNYDYVRKLFKKETGITPHEYLVQSRMQLAKELILSGMSNQYSNYTISQLAEACGFSEPLYFSRVFKANFGISPALYKERSKKEQN